MVPRHRLAQRAVKTTSVSDCGFDVSARLHPWPFHQVTTSHVETRASLVVGSKGACGYRLRIESWDGRRRAVRSCEVSDLDQLCTNVAAAWLDDAEFVPLLCVLGH